MSHVCRFLSVTGIVAFELIDGLTSNGASDSTDEAEAAQSGSRHTGLIKVVLFLTMPFALTLVVRGPTGSTSLK